MPYHIILLILFAAILHASWNAALRGGTDRLWSMTIMCLAVAIASVAMALVLEAPAEASWFYAGLSAVLHVGYNLFLVRSYKFGDLGQTYPISRGSSPILITLAASVFAGETVGAVAMFGIFLVSGGIISLAFRGRKLAVPSLPYALGTGCFIAAYSVTDGIGVRLSGAPMAYTVWMCALWGVLMPLVYVGMRDAKSLFTFQPGVHGGFLRRPCFTAGLWDRHLCHVRRAHGGGIGIARNQRIVRGIDRIFFLGGDTDCPKILACAVITIGTIIIG